ncbi:hypothetical protein TNCV_2304291 [Trichonephila clavipes]|nr:hypothetical protein TNCV_2304291 [Trichonephila clavipes]
MHQSRVQRRKVSFKKKQREATERSSPVQKRSGIYWTHLKTVLPYLAFEPLISPPDSKTEYACVGSMPMTSLVSACPECCFVGVLYKERIISALTTTINISRGLCPHSGYLLQGFHPLLDNRFR